MRSIDCFSWHSNLKDCDQHVANNAAGSVKSAFIGTQRVSHWLPLPPTSTAYAAGYGRAEAAVRAESRAGAISIPLRLMIRIQTTLPQVVILDGIPTALTSTPSKPKTTANHILHMNVASSTSAATQETNATLKGTLIGVGAGLALAGLCIAFFLWNHRRRLERRRLETMFGPTPFIVRPNNPVTNINRPNAHPTGAGTAVSRVVQSAEASKKLDDPHNPSHRAASRARAATPKRPAIDLKQHPGIDHFRVPGRKVANLPPVYAPSA